MKRVYEIIKKTLISYGFKLGLAMLAWAGITLISYYVFKMPAKDAYSFSATVITILFIITIFNKKKVQ